MNEIIITLNKKPKIDNQGKEATSLQWGEVIQALQYVGLVKKGDVPHKVKASSKGIEVTYVPDWAEKRVQE